MDTYYIRQHYMRRLASRIDWGLGKWFNAVLPVKHEELERLSDSAALEYILRHKLNDIHELEWHMNSFNFGKQS